jgi:hypothetical protein
MRAVPAVAADLPDTEQSLNANLLDLSRQQRNLLLLRPLFQLELYKNRIGDEVNGVFQGLDTHYLALTALDVMMEGTTVSTGATSQEVLSKLAEVAVRMKPELSAVQANRIADVVLGALDNKANNYKEFAFEHYDAAKGDMRTVRFRLVAFEPDMEDISRYKPTSEGYLVYLGMLDLSPEDSQELMEKMLDLLVQRGRFDSALEIARRARAYSIEYRQLIRDRLNQAYRAPGSVNWTRDVADNLSKAREHVGKRQREDQRMEESVADALRLADESKSRSNLSQLLKTIQGAALIRSRLVTDITGASEKFLEAHRSVFRARRPTGLPDLESVLLPRTMGLAVQTLSDGADDIIAALYPSQFLTVFDLNSMFNLLLEPKREEIEAIDDDGDLVPYMPPLPQFEQSLIDEVSDWLQTKFSVGRQITLEELLEDSKADGMDRNWRRCLVFVAMRSFAHSETDFKTRTTEVLDDFISDISQGTNIAFTALNL